MAAATAHGALSAVVSIFVVLVASLRKGEYIYFQVSTFFKNTRQVERHLHRFQTSFHLNLDSVTFTESLNSSSESDT